jgi:hypothetical protein
MRFSRGAKSCPRAEWRRPLQTVGSGHLKRQTPCPSTADPDICPDGRVGCCTFGRVCVLIAGEPGCCPIGIYILPSSIHPSIPTVPSIGASELTPNKTGMVCDTVDSCPVDTFQCSESLGGGCCPDGMTCSLLAGGSCIIRGGEDPPPSTACPAGRFRCAASLGGGCCASGQTCAADGTCRIPTDVDVSSSRPATTFRGDDTFSLEDAPTATTTAAAATRTFAESAPTASAAEPSATSLSNAVGNAVGWELGGAVAAAAAVGLAAVL